FQFDNGSSLDNGREGESVRLLYDPANPSHARLDTGKGPWDDGFAPTATGLSFIVGSSVLYLLLRRRWRRGITARQADTGRWRVPAHLLTGRASGRGVRDPVDSDRGQHGAAQRTDTRHRRHTAAPEAKLDAPALAQDRASVHDTAVQPTVAGPDVARP